MDWTVPAARMQVRGASAAERSERTRGGGGADRRGASGGVNPSLSSGNASADRRSAAASAGRSRGGRLCRWKIRGGPAGRCKIRRVVRGAKFPLTGAALPVNPAPLAGRGEIQWVAPPGRRCRATLGRSTVAASRSLAGRAGPTPLDLSRIFRRAPGSWLVCFAFSAALVGINNAGALRAPAPPRGKRPPLSLPDESSSPQARGASAHARACGARWRLRFGPTARQL